LATDDNLTQRSGNQAGASLFKVLCTMLNVDGSYKQKKDKIIDRIDELIKYEENAQKFFD
jgi:hypothetical protein